MGERRGQGQRAARKTGAEGQERRTVLRMVLAVDVARRRLGLDAEDRVADLGREAKLEVEEARLAHVLGLCAHGADLGLLVPRALTGEPLEDLREARGLGQQLVESRGARREERARGRTVKGRVQTLHSAPRGCLLMRMYLRAQPRVSPVAPESTRADEEEELTGSGRGRRCTARGSRSTRVPPCSGRPWAASWRS